MLTVALRAMMGFADGSVQIVSIFLNQRGPQSARFGDRIADGARPCAVNARLRKALAESRDDLMRLGASHHLSEAAVGPAAELERPFRTPIQTEGGRVVELRRVEVRRPNRDEDPAVCRNGVVAQQGCSGRIAEDRTEARIDAHGFFDAGRHEGEIVVQGAPAIRRLEKGPKHETDLMHRVVDACLEERDALEDHLLFRLPTLHLLADHDRGEVVAETLAATLGEVAGDEIVGRDKCVDGFLAACAIAGEDRRQGTVRKMCGMFRLFERC